MSGGLESAAALAFKPLLSKIAGDLAKHGWGALRDRVRGDALALAITRVFDHAYRHLQIADRAAGLQPAEQDIIAEALRSFVSHEDVLHQLIDLALGTEEPPREYLTRRFAFYHGDLENFPQGFPRAIAVFITGLRAGIQIEAQSIGSPLHGRVTIQNQITLLRTLERLEQKVEGIPGAITHPPASVQASSTAQVPLRSPAFQLDPISSAGLPDYPTNDMHEAITRAAQPTLDGDPQTAIGRLTQLREEQWDDMDSRARYRLLANLGNAHERRGDHDRAAAYHREAVTYQPEDPDARALEALALMNQDRASEAFALTTALLPRHPYHERLNAIRVRTAPTEWTIDAIERLVPTHLHARPEVAAALAQRAFDAGNLVRAEHHARAALATAPTWDGAQTLLATIILTEAQRVWLAGAGGALPAVQVTRVEEAIILISAVLRQLQPIAVPATLVRLRLNRSLAYRLLGKDLEASQDIQVADDLAHDDPDVALRYGAWLWDQGEQERAIARLASQVATDARPDLVLTLAQWRFIRRNGTDLADAARDLAALLGALGPDDTEFADDAVSLLIAVYLAEKQIAAAQGVLESPVANALSPVGRTVLASNIALLDGRRGEAEALARDALAEVDATTPRDDVLRLAFMGEAFGWWAEALGLWQMIAPTDRLTPVTQQLLACAQRAGADDVVLATCRALREGGIWDPQCFDTELALLERYHAFPEAQALMEEYLRAPTDADLEAHICIRLALLALRTGQEALVARLVPQLPPVDTVEVGQGRAIVDVLRFGVDPAKGIGFAYDLWRRFPDEPEAFDAVIASFNMVNGPEIKLDSPSTVAPGCAVGYREAGKREVEWWVIEDAPDPRQTHRELAPDSPLARTVLGKAQGDEITLPGSPFYPRTVRIEEIVPKAVYRWRWCVEEQSRYFPDRAYVQAVPLPVGPDGELDPEPLFRQAEARAKERQRVNDLYRRGPVTIATFAATAGASIIETMAYLASEPNLPVHSGAVDGPALIAAYNSVRKAEALVVDLTALGTLLVLGEETALTTMPVPVVVTLGAVERIRSLLSDALTAREAAGHLVWTPEGTVLVEHSPEQQQRRADRLQTLLNTIEACCQIEPGTALASLPSREREQLIKYCGREGAEAITIARQAGRVLWVDDTWAGVIASQLCGVRSAWTHAILAVYRDTGALDASFVARTSARLQAAGYTATLLSPTDIVQAVADGQWLLTNPLIGGALDVLASPLLSTEGVVRIATHILKPIWQVATTPGHSEALTWRVLERLGRRQEGELIIAALRRSIALIFGLDVVRAKRAAEAFDLWSATGKSGRLVLSITPESVIVPAPAPQLVLPG